MARLSLVGFALLLSSSALAQTTESDKTLAEMLFADAKKLMAENKWSEACPKLQESERLDPGGGTMLNLAVCHENQGKIASAWVEFKEALGYAKRDGRQDREDLASQHIEALTPRLPKLTVKVPPEIDRPDLEIKVDNVVVGRVGWGTAVPVDPGEHSVTASAKGKLSRTEKVSVIEAQAADIVIGPLTDAPPEEQPGESKKMNGTTIGIVIGAVGLLPLGFGITSGILAISKRSESDKYCSGDTCSDQRGIDANNQAKTWATLANVFIPIGIIAEGVAIVFIAMGSGSKKTTGVRVMPTAGTSAVGLEVGGAF